MRLRPIKATVIACVAALLWSGAAQAQFTNRDGYNEDGTYRVQAEIDPYAWIPATSSTIHFAHPNGGVTINQSTGLPSASQLSSVLNVALMGAALVRYGPFSAGFDLQWVSAIASRDRMIDGTRLTIHTNEALALVRVAPELGYQVVSTEVYDVPISVDARVGFSYDSVGASLNPARAAFTGLSRNDSFTQPFLGLRADIFPTPDWRVELGGMVQGFGVDGGSWGWGASAIVSYLVTSWFDVSLGFRALNTERFGGRNDQRSINLTMYGPLLGVGFRF